MAKFRKKHVIIEAVKVTAMLVEAMAAERNEMIPELIVRAGSKIGSMWTTDPHLIVKTPEGDMRANSGDWVIEDGNGEVYPCKPDIFDKTYDTMF